jgi:hypothetical protein
LSYEISESAVAKLFGRNPMLATRLHLLREIRRGISDRDHPFIEIERVAETREMSQKRPTATARNQQISAHPDVAC